MAAAADADASSSRSHSCSSVLGFGFRFSGFGFRFSGFGFLVSGLGLRVIKKKKKNRLDYLAVVPRGAQDPHGGREVPSWHVLREHPEHFVVRCLALVPALGYLFKAQRLLYHSA